MSKITLYLKESYTELTKKTTWPTWSRLQNLAVIVMIASAIFATVVFLMDYVFRHSMSAIYNLL